MYLTFASFHCCSLAAPSRSFRRSTDGSGTTHGIFAENGPRPPAFQTAAPNWSSGADPFQQHMRRRRQRVIEERDVRHELRAATQRIPQTKRTESLERDLQFREPRTTSPAPWNLRLGNWLLPSITQAVVAAVPLGKAPSSELDEIKRNVKDLVRQQGILGLSDDFRQIEQSAISPMYFPLADPATFSATQQVHQLRDETAEEILAGIRSSAKPVPKDLLPARPGSMRPTAPLVTVPEILKYSSPSVPLGRIVPSASTRGVVPFFRSGAERYLQDFASDLVLGDWWGGLSRKAGQRFTSATIANKNAIVSAGVGLRDGITDVGAGWKDFIFYEYTNRVAQETAIGLAKGRYGVFVDRSNLHRATAAQVIARNIAASTLVDFEDRDYGQRLKLRNFDLSIRHDFDEYLTKDPEEFATEIMVGFRKAGVGLSTDVADAVYAATVGIRGRQVSVLHDYDDRRTETLVGFGAGWNAHSEFDFIDPFSETIYAKFGFGNSDLLHVSVGAGVADDGIPQADATVELLNSAAFVRVLDQGGRKSLDIALTVGKHSYAWRSAVAAHNLRLPKPFGIEPTDVLNFLSGKKTIKTAPKFS